MHRQDNFFILTGTSSTGKTALLEHLRKLGFQCNAEAPREVLTQQRAISAPALHDPQVFVSMIYPLPPWREILCGTISEVAPLKNIQSSMN